MTTAGRERSWRGAQRSEATDLDGKVKRGGRGEDKGREGKER